MRVKLNFSDLQKGIPHRDVFEKACSGDVLDPHVIELILPDDATYSLRHMVDNFEEFVSWLKQKQWDTRVEKKFSIGRVYINFDRKYPDNSQVRYELTHEHVNKLNELEQIVNSNGGICRYGEVEPENYASYAWTLDDLVLANESIDYLADCINKNNLSPYEAVFFVSNWISTNLTYGLEDRGFEINNTIVSAFKNLMVRCVGASQLVNAIFDKTNFKLSELRYETLSVNSPKNGVGHSVNLIYIDDPKYKIKGYGVLDPYLPDSEEKSAKYRNNFIDDAQTDKPDTRQVIWVHTFLPVSSFYKKYMNMKDDKDCFIYENLQDKIANIDQLCYSKCSIDKRKKDTKKAVWSFLFKQIRNMSVKDNIPAFSKVYPLLAETLIYKDKNKLLREQKENLQRQL